MCKQSFTEHELWEIAQCIRSMNGGKLSPHQLKLLDKIQAMRIKLLFNKQHQMKGK